MWHVHVETEHPLHHQTRRAAESARLGEALQREVAVGLPREEAQQRLDQVGLEN